MYPGKHIWYRYIQRKPSLKIFCRIYRDCNANLFRKTIFKEL